MHFASRNQQPASFAVTTMEQEMVLISKPVVELMLLQLHRAEGYCAKAKSILDPTLDIVNDDATASYAGANGYAGATMRDIIQTLESHRDV